MFLYQEGVVKPSSIVPIYQILGNPIDICIGVFDKDGNWVSENVLGDPILEGLTQVRLF